MKNFQISSLNIDDARLLAKTIEMVLDKRTHKRTHLGEEIIVKGTLSKALHLPDIQKQLTKNNSESQQRAIIQLSEIWEKLSTQTHKMVLEKIGLFEPKELNWDDPRSNRLPKIISTI